MHLPGTFSKQIVLAIDMNHSILENTLPLVLDSCNLPQRTVN